MLVDAFSQVSDAIPIPGFLDTLQPTVQAARASNVSSSSSMSSAEEGGSSSSSGAEQQLLAAAAASLPLAEQQQLLLAGAAPALEQLSSVVNEVRPALLGVHRLLDYSAAAGLLEALHGAHAA